MNDDNSLNHLLQQLVDLVLAAAEVTTYNIIILEFKSFII